MSTIKEILESEAGAELKAFLTNKCEELRDIENLVEYTTPTHQVLELKAQKKAYKKVKSILEEIMSYEIITPKVDTNEYAIGDDD